MKRILYVLILLTIITVPAAAQTNLNKQVYATAQRFERGLMIYTSDDGFIWALADSGAAFPYPSSVYSKLPDNPFKNPPAGKLSPIFGFGKIWGNDASIRDQFGWATLPEIGFTMPVMSVSSNLYFTQLNGKIIELNIMNKVWKYVSSIPNPPSAQIVSFVATPNPANIGDKITLSWEVKGTEFVIIEVKNNPALNAPLAYFFVPEPLKSTKTFTIPLDTSGDVEITLWAANYPKFYTSTPMYERVSSSKITVKTQAAATSVQSAYQRFEHGFMIWRGDTGAVHVFYDNASIGYYAENTYAIFPNNPITSIPAGFVNPVNAFGKVWGNMDDVRQGLGYAVTGEQGYALKIQPAGASTAYTLPDGRTIYAGASSWGF